MIKTSNYQLLNRQWADKLCRMDHQELLNRIPSLTRENGFICLNYFNRRLGMDEQTGEIAVLDHGEPLSENTKLNVYTYFWYCQKDARPEGRWMPFRELKDARPFGPAFQTGVHEALAATFDGHMNRLEYAAGELGGQPLSMGDLSFQFTSFPEIPVQLIFWDGDEEFPAQANMLFDTSAPRYIHVESVVTIAMDLLDSLVKKSGLPFRGSPFRVN